MTQNEIIEIAGQHFCRIEYGNGNVHEGYEFSFEELEAFAKLVAAHEREACAKVCDSFQERDVGMQPAECAGAIRARGEQA